VFAGEQNQTASGCGHERTCKVVFVHAGGDH
jgi:hypothetical protein